MFQWEDVNDFLEDEIDYVPSCFRDLSVEIFFFFNLLALDKKNPSTLESAWE